MGNLDFRQTTITKETINIGTIAKYWEVAKKYWHKAMVVIMALYLALQTGIAYYNEHINEPTTNKVVVVDRNSFHEAVKRNQINESPAPNQIVSRFSGSTLAELVVPNSVDVYKLVRIKTDKVASFYDVMVMTVYNANIVFIDAVPTANKGEWVFTGPPGQYAVRLSAYEPTSGVSVETGNVIIGVPVPIPNPNPTPNPTPNPIPNPTPVFTEVYGFSTLSFNSAMKVEVTARKQYKDALADNFEAVAAAIAAGSFDTPNASNTELAGRHRLTFNNNQTEINKWLVFFTDWQAKATELNKAGKLPNLVQEYRLVYLETARGLRASQ